jgi:hypothetical protein
MACTEFSRDNNFYIKRRNLIVLLHFENRQVFLPHAVLMLKVPRYEMSQHIRPHITNFSECFSKCALRSDGRSQQTYSISLKTKYHAGRFKADHTECQAKHSVRVFVKIIAPWTIVDTSHNKITYVTNIWF